MEENKELLLAQFNLMEERIESLLSFFSHAKISDFHLAKAKIVHINKLTDDFEKWNSEILLFNVKVSTSKETSTINLNKEINKFWENLEVCSAKFSRLSHDASNSDVKKPVTSVNVSHLVNNDSIPNFSGNLKDFNQFINVFNSIVHQNNNLDDLYKLIILKSKLKGEALTLINSLDLIPSNYEEAYNILIEKYQSERVVATYYLKEILNYPKHGNFNTTDFITQHKNAITNIQKLELENESDFVFFLLTYMNLNETVRKQFDLSNSQNVPCVKDLFSFLENRDRSEQISGILLPESEQKYKSPQKSALLTKFQENNCLCCKNNFHYLMFCPTYLKYDALKRFEFVKKHRLCFKCLKPHQSNTCQSTKVCKNCQNPSHNTTLCKKQGVQSQNRFSSENQNFQSNNIPMSLACANETNKSVLLGTIRLHVVDKYGKLQTLRAVLDTASQCELITKQAADILGLQCQRSNSKIIGINQNSNKSYGKVEVKLFHKNPFKFADNNFSFNVTATVVESISGSVPQINVPQTVVNNCRQYYLADPYFNSKVAPAMLLGVETFCELYDCSRRFIKGEPSLLPTKIGYVVCGKFFSSNPSSQNNFSFNVTEVSCDNLSNDLQMFWKEEQNDFQPKYIHQNNMLPEHQYVETKFKKSFYRQSDGKCVVAYPFKEGRDSSSLGCNKSKASAIFYAQERKLLNLPQIKKMYDDFLEEYLNSNHMSEVTNSKGNYFLPHRYVFKNQITQDKIRVVFNASSKAQNGRSLNDEIYAGPVLHNELAHILFEFRINPIALCADIKNMFRCFLIEENQRVAQQILWRKNTHEPLKTYQLNTVTYGVNASPYLAQRCLHELALSEKDSFPLAAKAIFKGFYVDDLVFACSNLNEAIQLKSQLIQLLSSAGLELRKWSSSHDSVLKDLPSSFIEKSIQFNNREASVKVLGIYWSPEGDSFTYHTYTTNCTPTKRNVLSFISKLFDPLNLINPIIFKAKLIIQDIWKAKVGWDDPLPDNILNHWDKFKSFFPQIEQIKIPRYIIDINFISIRLVIFGDASKLGYGSVAYIHIELNNSKTISNLVRAKSRLNPLKGLTIPRAELCAALLSTQLAQDIVSNSSIKFNETLIFSDSMVCLSWIFSKKLSKLTSYVYNRVNLIKSVSQNFTWSYVSSKENPADILSRGCYPHELVNNYLWWHGPHFLKEHRSRWPIQSVSEDSSSLDDSCESNPVALTTLICDVQENYVYEKLKKHSSFIKVINILSYVRRFIHNCRFRSDRFNTSYLLVKETKQAEMCLFKMSQELYLTDVIKDVTNKKPSRLIKLTPFIHNGILRVEGRLALANLEFNQKHPIILSNKCYFVKLLIKFFHETYLHVGPTTVRSLLRNKFWIISSFPIIRKIIRSCVVCTRSRNKGHQPFMSNLPWFRVKKPDRPFQFCGTDFAGPFYIKSSNLKKAPIQKAYFVVFVCLSVRAIHIELCSSLSTDCFLAAFHRFVSRRSLPSTMFSDCGSNYLGAASKLREVQKFLNTNNENIYNALSKYQVEWAFNPPAAPSFGGSWEIQVKLIKNLLYKHLGNTILNYEEMNTILIRIEAIINSRPLEFLSEDSDSSNFLTPAHFLVQGPLIGVPELSVTKQESLKCRWSLVNQTCQFLWNKWHKSYLNNLIQRHKWGKKVDNIQVNQLVYLMDVNSKPNEWPLGRVIQTHPGKDGVVRVVTIRCNNKEYVRPSNKLIVIDSDSTL